MHLAPGKPCPLCSAPLRLKHLPATSGDEAPLRLTLHGMPVLACDKPHTYFVESGFPLWLMNHLLEQEGSTLPAGEATGFLFKSYRCHACAHPLPAKQDHLHGFSVLAAYPGQQEFRVELAMPVFRCAGCGKEQVHSLEKVRKLTPSALVHAFKEAGIKAPG